MSLVINIITGHLYTQYHVGLDVNLSTVDHMRKGIVPGNWKKMIQEHSELYIQEEINL